MKQIFNKKRYLIFKYIIDNPGLKSTKIARNLEIKNNNIFTIINKFEKIGIITKGEQGTHKNIFVTEKGLEVFKYLNILYDVWKL